MLNGKVMASWLRIHDVQRNILRCNHALDSYFYTACIAVIISLHIFSDIRCQLNWLTNLGLLLRISKANLNFH